MMQENPSIIMCGTRVKAIAMSQHQNWLALTLLVWPCVFLHEGWYKTSRALSHCFLFCSEYAVGKGW